MNESVIIDASVMVTLLIRPDNDSLHDRLRGRILHAPEHLYVESMNVIRRLRAQRTITPSEADLAIRGLLNEPVRSWPFAVLAERVWQLGDNVSAYDGAYIALAEQLELPLLTTDARLARSPGTSCVVEVF